MTRIRHFLVANVVQGLIALPTLLVSPTVQHFVEHHAGLAIYLPLANAAAAVIALKLRERKPAPA